MKAANNLSKPCCGYYLHGAVRLFSLFLIGLGVGMPCLIWSHHFDRETVWVDVSKESNVGRNYYYVLSSFFLFAHPVLYIFQGVFLLKASKLRNITYLITWIILQIIDVIVVFTMLGCGVVFIASLEFNFGFLVLNLFYAGFKFYASWLVYSFILEIQAYGHFNATLRELTDAEIAELEMGSTVPESGEYFSTLNFKQNVEIPLENLSIDEDFPLGSGNFGITYHAKMTKTNENGSSEVSRVVVKTTKNCDVSHFKLLLEELRILASLEHHENIVNMIGTCSSLIRQRKLYIVLEFCPLGNLCDYLKARRGIFITLVKDGQISPSYLGEQSGYVNIKVLKKHLTTVDLINWLTQACKGMEYLASQGIVQGDIAARNILLSQDKRAKICDFGLAIRVNAMKQSRKQNKEIPLPWPWLAIETLRDMEFSAQSDIWSFGVTLWEVFSLGEVPFPGYAWNEDFIDKLTQGLRMSRPLNSTTLLYDLMVKCWSPCPNKRPHFQEIRQALEEELYKITACLFANDRDNQEEMKGQPEISSPAGVTHSGGSSPESVDIYVQL